MLKKGRRDSEKEDPVIIKKDLDEFSSKAFEKAHFVTDWRSRFMISVAEIASDRRKI